MYRRTLIIAAATLLAGAATQLASADQSSGPRAVAAAGGLSVSPAIVERTARRGATASATVTNTSGRTLRVAVGARPWRQSRTGAVAANRSRRLSGVSVSSSRFRLASGSSRNVSVRLARVPARRSTYGALDIVGKPVRRRRGINVAYRLVSSVRFNPTARGRRLRLGAGGARVSGSGGSRVLVLRVRNRGNTVDSIAGSVSIARARGGRSGTISAVRILPGKVVDLRVAALSGMPRGRYRAGITLTQRGRNITSVTRRFRIGR